MKYLSEYRDPALASKLLDGSCTLAESPIKIMEVCGGQTHSLVKNGIIDLLPDNVEMIHGPGCPVCVTPLHLIDKAVYLASEKEVILCSFGDMLRVPGSNIDLFTIKANGGQVRIVYSALDAVRIAQENPDKEIVFFGIGFETTTPGNAASIVLADKLNLKNFSLLVSQVTVPPAIEAILSSPSNRVQAFLAAGHVCAVMGYWQYETLAAALE